MPSLWFPAKVAVSSISFLSQTLKALEPAWLTLIVGQSWIIRVSFNIHVLIFYSSLSTLLQILTLLNHWNCCCDSHHVLNPGSLSLSLLGHLIQDKARVLPLYFLSQAHLTWRTLWSSPWAFSVFCISPWHALLSCSSGSFGSRHKWCRMLG